MSAVPDKREGHIPPEMTEFIELMAQLLVNDYIKRIKTAPPAAEEQVAEDPEGQK